jgi:hypothetical protein
LPIHAAIPRSLAEVTATGKSYPLHEVGLLETPGIRSITDLKGKRVGVQATGSRPSKRNRALDPAHRISLDANPCVNCFNQRHLGKSSATPLGSSTGDEVTQSHVYRRDVDLTIERGTIVEIGSAAPADNADAVEIEGRGFAVLPGFVDIYAHPSSEPMLKGLTDEVGSRQLYMSSLYEYLPLYDADPEGRRAATEVALCELMQSGVTTVCDLSAARDDWLDTLGTSGMRVYVAPMFRSGRWYTPNGHEVRYTWNEQAGRDGLDRALRLIDRARQHPSDRLDGVLYPAQVDTCTEALLRALQPRASAGCRSRSTRRRASSSFTRSCGGTGKRQSNGCSRSACSVQTRLSATRSFSTIIPGCTGRPATTSPTLPKPVQP